MQVHVLAIFSVLLESRGLVIPGSKALSTVELEIVSHCFYSCAGLEG